MVDRLLQKVDSVKKLIEESKHQVNPDDWEPMDPGAKKKTKAKAEKVIEQPAPSKEKMNETATSGAPGNST